MARPAASSILDDDIPMDLGLGFGTTPSTSTASKPMAITPPKTKKRSTNKLSRDTAQKRLGLQAFELERVEKHIFALANELFGIDELNVVRRSVIDGAISVFSLFMAPSMTKKINTALAHASGADSTAHVVELLKEMLWPDGTWGEAAEAYPVEQAAIDRELSKERLLESIPEQLATLLTSSVVKGGAAKIHGLLQCPVMTKNLLYTLVDMLLLRLFEQEHDHAAFPVEGLYNMRSKSAV